ncbi:hypothetical protein [Nostoc sp. 106C]|uniref:hypothetical protein n=1 Tax=Nostoc sp. 106C TaxID=1932667 RepID=UPI001064DB3D|nr:hypothetical protein [Nostoc sp. 106C]
MRETTAAWFASSLRQETRLPYPARTFFEGTGTVSPNRTGLTTCFKSAEPLNAVTLQDRTGSQRTDD